MNDTLKKYLTTDHAARIQTLRLSHAWQTGLAHQALPPPLERLLGELSAACVLLASNLKFDGSVILQIQGNGPVSLIVVECTASLGLRATAHLRDGARLPPAIGLQDLMNEDGQGRFSVMLDPADRKPGSALYQGIVPIEGDSVAAALEHYMQHSEQLDTRLWLAADSAQCAGVLLQRMPEPATRHTPEPSSDRTPDDTWAHCLALAETLGPDELLQTDPDTLMHRLFWNDDLLAFPAEPVRWACACTRTRVADMLRSLGREEIQSILDEQATVEVDCHFCGKPYRFDAVDCAALFVDDTEAITVQGTPSVH